MRELACEELNVVAGGNSSVDPYFMSAKATGTALAMLDIGLKYGVATAAGAALLPVAGAVAIGGAIFAAGIASYWIIRAKQ